MAIGWLYLYSKHRKNRRRLRELEHRFSDAICDNCGHAFYKHADDTRRTCPKY